MAVAQWAAAQLSDRALDSLSEGHGFQSCRELREHFHFQSSLSVLSLITMSSCQNAVSVTDVITVAFPLLDSFAKLGDRYRYPLSKLGDRYRHPLSKLGGRYRHTLSKLGGR